MFFNEQSAKPSMSLETRGHKNNSFSATTFVQTRRAQHSTLLGHRFYAFVVFHELISIIQRLD